MGDTQPIGAAWVDSGVLGGNSHNQNSKKMVAKNKGQLGLGGVQVGREQQGLENQEGNDGRLQERNPGTDRETSRPVEDGEIGSSAFGQGVRSDHATWVTCGPCAHSLTDSRSCDPSVL